MVGFVQLWDLNDGFVPLFFYKISKTDGFVPYKISKIVSFVLVQEFNDGQNFCNKFMKF